MTRQRTTLLACGLLSLGVLLALGGGGCSREGAPLPSPCTDASGNPVDPTLLAFLSRARSAHHSADRHEEQGRLDDAIQALETLSRGPLPQRAEQPTLSEQSPLAPEVREVLADTHARLADLQSQQKQFERAENDIRRGLELVPQRNYFRGHLLEMRGVVAERQAKDLKAKGQAQQAAELERRALNAFEESMKIQAEVIDEAVGKPSRP